MENEEPMAYWPLKSLHDEEDEVISEEEFLWLQSILDGTHTPQWVLDLHKEIAEENEEIVYISPDYIKRVNDEIAANAGDDSTTGDDSIYKPVTFKCWHRSYT